MQGFFFINAVEFQKNGVILVPLSTCAIFGFFFCWSVAEIFHFRAKDGCNPVPLVVLRMKTLLQDRMSPPLNGRREI